MRWICPKSPADTTMTPPIAELCLWNLQCVVESYCCCMWQYALYWTTRLQTSKFWLWFVFLLDVKFWSSSASFQENCSSTWWNNSTQNWSVVTNSTRSNSPWLLEVDSVLT
jgi:hypothetical protein